MATRTFEEIERYIEDTAASICGANAAPELLYEQKESLAIAFLDGDETLYPEGELEAFLRDYLDRHSY